MPKPTLYNDSEQKYVSIINVYSACGICDKSNDKVNEHRRIYSET